MRAYPRNKHTHVLAHTYTDTHTLTLIQKLTVILRNSGSFAYICWHQKSNAATWKGITRWPRLLANISLHQHLETGNSRKMSFTHWHKQSSLNTLTLTPNVCLRHRTTHRHTITNTLKNRALRNHHHYDRKILICFRRDLARSECSGQTKTSQWHATKRKRDSTNHDLESVPRQKMVWKLANQIPLKGFAYD